MKLSQVCAEATRWGVYAAEPNPRPTAPHLPIDVVRTGIRPDSRYGLLVRGKQKELKGADLIPDDLLLHLGSGVVVRVLERIDHLKSRVEAWTMPETEKDLDNWASTVGTGKWVVWGRCYSTPMVPAHLVPSEIVTPGPDMAKAIGDLYPHLVDRLTARLEMGIPETPVPDLSRLPPRVRKKIMHKMRKLLGKMAKVREWDSQDKIDEQRDKGTYFKRTTPEGAEVVKWRPPVEDDE